MKPHNTTWEERVYQFVMDLHKKGIGGSIEQPVKDLVTQERKRVVEEVLRELLDLLGKLPARTPLPKHLLAIDIHAFAKEKGVELNK